MQSHRIATYEDLHRFYGRKLPMTVKAVCVLNDDEPIMVAGVSFHRGEVTMFLDMKDGAEMYPVAIMKGVKKIMTDLKADGYRALYAVADTGIESSIRFLKHIGFVHSHGDVYKWEP